MIDHANARVDVVVEVCENLAVPREFEDQFHVGQGERHPIVSQGLDALFSGKHEARCIRSGPA